MYLLYDNYFQASHALPEFYAKSDADAHATYLNQLDRTTNAPYLRLVAPDYQRWSAVPK